MPAYDSSMIAKAIHDALTAQGRGSRVRMASALDVSNATVSKWAQGQTTPEIERWGAIESYFEWPTGHLARISGLPIARSVLEYGGLRLLAPPDFVVNDGEHVTIVFVGNDAQSLELLRQAAEKDDLPSARRQPNSDAAVERIRSRLEEGGVVRLRLEGSDAEIYAVVDEADVELPAAAKSGKATGARKSPKRKIEAPEEPP